MNVVNKNLEKKKQEIKKDNEQEVNEVVREVEN